MSASKKRVIRYDDKIKELPCDQLYSILKDNIILGLLFKNEANVYCFG